MDKRITNSCLMFVQITKASRVIPLPYVQPLFLDILTTSDVMDSNRPSSPHAFRAFRLHRIIYVEGGVLRTQVAFPCLNGKTKSHLLNFQKQLLIPELQEQSQLSVTLAMVADEHWNIANDHIYLACLLVFRRRHQASQASQAEGSAETTPSPTASALLPHQL